MERATNAQLSIANMLIKYQALAANLAHGCCALSILIGQDPYLINDSALQIKNKWLQQGESDSKTLHLNSSTDWDLMLDEANSYSLFAEHLLLNVYLDKKTIEKKGLNVLLQYLKNVNARTRIILRGPNLLAKNLTTLAKNEQVLIVQAYPFTSIMMQRWIVDRLNKNAIAFEHDIPSLIHQHTEGNMLACAQVVDKLVLTHPPNTILSAKEAMEHLIDQCEYPLFELADACLGAQSEKALHLLGQAALNRREPTLILWLLAQEIRQLIQLSHMLKQSLSLQTACSQLKIWPQKTSLYQAAVSRIPLKTLYVLLKKSHQLDALIKSNKSSQIWNLFEKLVLNLCAN